MSHRTAIVILNWNTRHFLEQFLPDVVRFSERDAEIIVADNASTDDSVDFLRKNFPSVRIIQNPVNDGYTGGYNAALQHVDSEYFVLLNSDVKVTENWLNPVIAMMDNDKSIAACQPKILSFSEPRFFEYAGAAGGYIDSYGYPFCRGRIFNSLEEDHGQYDDARPVFWATGACMFVRAKVFRELKGFDANFFAHMEEIDFCWRIQNAGYKVYYNPGSVVYHVGGGTLPKTNPRKTFLNFRNNLLMVYKNTSPGQASHVLQVRWVLDLLASLRFLLTSGFADFRAVWQAHSDFKRLKGLYSRPKQDSDSSGLPIFPKSIVWYYYLSGRKKFSSLGWKNATGGHS